MAHIIREEKEEPIFTYAIYAILSPFAQCVYVGKCLKERLKGTYKEHYNLKNKQTKTMFEAARKKEKLPPIYLLQIVECSKRAAFKHTVAWVKLFLNHGYELVCPDTMKIYANDLTEESKAIYQNICNINLDEICKTGNDLFPNYGKNNKRKTLGTPKTIHFSVKEQEYKHIKNEAEKNNMTLATFCKQRALTGKVIHINLDFMAEYLREFAEDKILIRQILYTIYTRAEYFPADLENLQRLVDDISQLQKEAQKGISEALQKLQE